MYATSSKTTTNTVIIMEQSLTQFLGEIVTESKHFRGDWFIFLESVIARLHDYTDTCDKELDVIIASHDCGAEWIYPEQCDGKSYNWHSITYYDSTQLYHIYKCHIKWRASAFTYDRVVDAVEINYADMVECINKWKSTNETVQVVKETIGV